MVIAMSIINSSDRANLCQQYLDILYAGTTLHQANDIPETYGEILYPALNKLINRVPLHADDVFVDLGSGIGKALVQVFLNSPVREARGIEIVHHLHQQAVSIAARIERELPIFYMDKRKLQFFLGDFLSFPLADATVIFLCSPCFTQQTLNQLGVLINGTPRIQSVLTLRPIANLTRLAFKETIRLECSWDSALCYRYGR